jgi:hypothetical protein
MNLYTLDGKLETFTNETQIPITTQIPVEQFEKLLKRREFLYNELVKLNLQLTAEGMQNRLTGLEKKEIKDLIEKISNELANIEKLLGNYRLKKVLVEKNGNKYGKDSTRSNVGYNMKDWTKEDSYSHHRHWRDWSKVDKAYDKEVDGCDPDHLRENIEKIKQIRLKVKRLVDRFNDPVIPIGEKVELKLRFKHLIDDLGLLARERDDIKRRCRFITECPRYTKTHKGFYYL